jgi:hypothetical protein
MRPKLQAAIAGIVVIVALGTVFASRAAADCGSWERRRITPAVQHSTGGKAQFRLLSWSNDSNDGIVGFWKVKFVSKDSPGIPDGTVVDSAYAQWHNDGTEIMNSSRPPATSNFCLGVWQKLGRSHYKLNHFALSSDLSGKLIGPARIQEDIFLDGDEDSYSGTFTIDQYDLSGNPLAHVAGHVTAKRITVNTTVQDVL